MKLLPLFHINIVLNIHWRAPKLLNRFKCESEVKIGEEQKVGDMFLGLQHFGVEECAGALGWD
jgi:hypothetical protein